MTKIDNFVEAREVLAKYVPLKYKKGSYSLGRMQKLMAELGNPQDSFKTIHVAGTSGKTSTCYYLSSLLKQTGKKIGMTVSPHIDEVNERVQINLTPLPEKEFCSELTELVRILNKLSITPTYFELLVAFAYWEFAKQKVDYAVVEVGLGGLLDGTNVINSPDKACVITDIGLDHTNVLGNSVEKIAWQKAGIIHDGNEVFCYKQGSEVRKVIRKVCEEKNANLHEIYEKQSEITKQLPLFQHHNWELAKEVVDYIVLRDELQPLSKKQQLDSTKILVPARMEEVEINGRTIILDGAHNPQKIGVLLKSLKDKYTNKKFYVLLGLLSGKDLDGVLKEIVEIAEEIVATEFEAGQDMPRGSIKVNQIMESAKANGFDSINFNSIPQSALKQLIENTPKGEIILVVGSFFLLNYVRPQALSGKV